LAQICLKEHQPILARDALAIDLRVKIANNEIEELQSGNVAANNL